MSNHYELISWEDGLPIRAFIQGIDRVKIHWHKYIEITLVLQGSAKVRIGNEIHLLKENDLAVINNNTIHNTTKTNKDDIILVFKIDPDYYSRYYNELNNVVFDCKSIGNQKHKLDYDIIRRYISNIVWEFNKKETDSKLIVGSQVHLLLAHLINNFKVKSTEDNPVINTNRDMERIQRIISYINANMEKGVTLQEVADKEGLNLYYTSHFIKRVLGMSFQEYLNTIRLDKALRLLSTTNRRITEISYESGFPSTKSLNRIFRREMSCSPTEYRRNIKDANFCKESYEKGNDSECDENLNKALEKLFLYLEDINSHR